MPSLQQITNASRDFVKESTIEERDRILRQVANVGISGPSIFDYEAALNARDSNAPMAKWISQIDSLCDAFSMPAKSELGDFSTVPETNIFLAA